MLAGMNLVVTLAANDDEIPFHVRSAVFMMFKVVEFQDSRVAGSPALMLPSTNATGVAVAFIYRLLNVYWYPTVVGLGNAIS